MKKIDHVLNISQKLYSQTHFVWQCSSSGGGGGGGGGSSSGSDGSFSW